MDDVLLIVMLAGVPVCLLVLLDIAVVIRFGWSASAFYPPVLRHIDAIMSMPTIRARKDQTDG